MPRASLPALALLSALGPACFKDLGSDDDGGPSASASSSTSAPDPSTSAATTSSPDPSTTTSDTDKILTSSDPVSPSDASGTTSIDLPACGDGTVDPDEACDPASPDKLPCTPDCTVNVCGDGYPLDGEACDDGNDAAGDGCSPACVPENCGDGLLAAPTEQCDDGNADGGDGCSECTLEWLSVFVTGNMYTGNLGGLAGADAQCAAEAAAAALPGTYYAWLSTAADMTPAARFKPAGVPYRLRGGQTVANSTMELLGGLLINEIDLLADGTEILADDQDCGSLVWTGTDQNGTVAPATCVGFTSDELNYTGQTGNYSAADLYWTNSCDASCNQTARLYCFQQIP